MCKDQRLHIDWNRVILSSTTVLKTDPTVHKRLLLTLDSEGKQLTAAQGAAIARRICDLVMREGKPGSTIHIFGALPLGILILVGWGLKAGRTIQFYDLDKGVYKPTCLFYT